MTEANTWDDKDERRADALASESSRESHNDAKRACSLVGQRGVGEKEQKWLVPGGNRQSGELLGAAGAPSSARTWGPVIGRVRNSLTAEQCCHLRNVGHQDNVIDKCSSSRHRETLLLQTWIPL